MSAPIDQNTKPDKWSVDPQWYDDNQEIGAFIRWYYEGCRATVSEICDIFEEPWNYDDGYQDFLMWKEDQRTGRRPW